MEFELVLDSLEENPYQYPADDDYNLPKGMYRKASFCKWYKALFSISNTKFFLDAVVDCRTGSTFGNMGKILCCMCLRDNSFPFPRQRFTDHEHIGNTIADIFRIHLFGLPRFTGYTNLLNQLFVRLIYADNWVERVVRPLIYFQHILHFRYKFRIRPGDAPFFDLPRLDFVFFITSQTVLSVM